MSKSYVDAMLRVSRGALTDATAIDPLLTKSCDRDYIKLVTLASNHGEALFTVLLPDLDKALCQSLDHGFLDLRQLPLSKAGGGAKIPRLFQGIWMKIFDSSGRLKQDADPTFVLILRQLLLGWKKLEVECSDSATFAAITEFFDVESSLPSAPSIWDGVEVVDARDKLGSTLDLCSPIGSVGGREVGRDTYDLLDRCQRVADIVAGSFVGESDEGGSRPYDPEFYRFRHGPGATAERGRGKSYKYRFPTWQPNLELAFPLDMYGVSNASILLGNDDELPQEIEVASRLCAVPKTQKGPRLIAAEPAANQWCQQNLLSFINERLESAANVAGKSIAFRRQDLSGNMAILASKTGRLATVDLKSASDRLTCWVVQRLWRANLPVLNAMVASRTRFMSQSIDKKHDSHLRLRKFATMGSALTFPVQSLAFYVMAIASGTYSEDVAVTSSSIAKLGRKVRVYGDDMIVPVDWVESLDLLMSTLFLKLNRDKTFTGKNFRESCGSDGFQGYDVTPVKIKTVPEDSKPSTLVSCVDTANLLHKKGLWHTAHALRSLGSDTGLRPPLVARTGTAWGDKTFVDEIPRPVKVRWNVNLHRYETAVLQPKAVGKQSSRSEGSANLLQFFTEDPYDPLATNHGSWESGLVTTSEAGFCRRWVPLDNILGLGQSD